MRKSALFIVLILCAAAACNKVCLTEEQQFGSVRLALSSDVEVVVDTKADDAVDYSDFLVNITGETFIGNTFSADYLYKEMTGDMPVPYGYYHVYAQSCAEEEAEAGLGKVRYCGVSDQVDILSQTPALVTVTCTMANGKVSLTFDDSFLEDFTDVKAELKVGDRTVSLTSVQANSSEVFFNVEPSGSGLVYIVYGTVAAGTEQERRVSYSNSGSPLTLLPAKWAKITIRSNHNGLIGPGIDVDDSMDSNGMTEIINPDGGVESLEGDVNLPVITVDTQMDDAVVVDCILDVLE